MRKYVGILLFDHFSVDSIADTLVSRELSRDFSGEIWAHIDARMGVMQLKFGRGLQEEIDR